MNKHPHGTIQSGAPGSMARQLSELEDLLYGRCLAIENALQHGYDSVTAINDPDVKARCLAVEVWLHDFIKTRRTDLYT